MKGAKIQNNDPPEFQAKVQHKTNLKSRRAENTMARVQHKKHQTKRQPELKAELQIKR